MKSRDISLLIPTLGDLLCKVSYRVIVADALHNLAYELNVVGVLALFNESTKHFADNSFEVLMTSVEEEAAAVGEHTTSPS